MPVVVAQAGERPPHEPRIFANHEPVDRVVLEPVGGVSCTLLHLACEQAGPAGSPPQKKRTLPDGDRAQPRTLLALADGWLPGPRDRQRHLLQDIVDCVAAARASRYQPLQPAPVSLDERRGRWSRVGNHGGGVDRCSHPEDIIAADRRPQKPEISGRSFTAFPCGRDDGP